MTDNFEKIKVLPAFPVDSFADQSAHYVAEKWASARSDPSRNKVIVPNDPITSVRILRIEERGNGGRAYKVLLDDKYLVDLREDVVIDTMLKEGIAPGGIINNKLIWVKHNTQMRLVIVDSILHKMIQEYESKSSLKPIKGALVPGKIYQDKKKNRSLFIGYINSVVYHNDDKKNIQFRMNTGHPANQPTFNYETTKLGKSLLFLSLYEHQNYKVDFTRTSFENKKSHTFIEEVGEHPVPDDVLVKIRRDAVGHIKKLLVEVSQKNNSIWPQTYWDLHNHIIALSTNMHMHWANEPAPELFDIKPLLLVI